MKHHSHLLILLTSIFFQTLFAADFKSTDQDGSNPPPYSATQPRALVIVSGNAQPTVNSQESVITTQPRRENSFDCGLCVENCCNQIASGCNAACTSMAKGAESSSQVLCNSRAIDCYLCPLGLALGTLSGFCETSCIAYGGCCFTFAKSAEASEGCCSCCCITGCALTTYLIPTSIGCAVSPLRGMYECGKRSLFGQEKYEELTMDDLRRRASADPEVREFFDYIEDIKKTLLRCMALNCYHGYVSNEDSWYLCGKRC